MRLYPALILFLLTGSESDRIELHQKKITMLNNLALSDYVTITVTVPETHADIVRKAMGDAGAGKFGHYSFCRFSTKDIARFMPNDQAQPCISKEYVLETVAEEKIETICAQKCLEKVIEK